ATVRPLATAARFLGGQDAAAELAARPVTVVDATYDKKLDLRVVSPLADLRGLAGGSIWSAIVPDVARLIEEHRTTLIFCNNRRLAERTADRLNEQRLLISEAESGDVGAYRPSGSDDLGIFATGVDPRLLEARGLAPIRAHHGSMSKMARLDLEQALKSGTLPALVCTASLELGIDIGEIDLVVHLQSPKSVAAGLQRVGRSGHLVGQTSVGRIYPTHVEDLLEAAAVCRGMLQAEIESTETPENPLDVLAQQLVAMVSVEDWSFDEALALVRGAYPFRSLGEGVFRSVLEMLSGKYPESVSRMLKAQISWDRVNNQLRALPGASVLAIGSGGTIPDRGTYSLVLADRHTKVGDLDEEFVFETRPGDTFLLGSHVWRVTEIGDDRVIAEPAPGEVPRLPFWRGDIPWRPYDLGRRIGAFRRELADLVRALEPEELEKIRSGEVSPTSPAARRLLDLLTRECALDPNSLVQVVDYVARQLDANGQIASDRTILAEVFSDAIGEPRLVIHSPFGGRVNGPWGVVLAGAIRERLGVEAQVISGDDGILLRFANADLAPPVDLVGQITSQEARERLLADLPGSATFVAQFRMNAARALLLPRERAGKRTPLWLSRLRAKDLLQAVQRFDDFPILLETYRDCLRDVMDVAGLTEVLDRIQRGEIELVVSESEVPSPLALGLDQRFSLQYVYEYDQPRGERQLAALTVNRELLADLLRDGTLAELVKPAAIAAVAARVARISLNDRARNAEELAQLLYELGDLAEPELRARCATDESDEWLAELALAGRAIEWRFGGSPRWVHAERQQEYAQLAADPGPVLRRYLAHAGPTALAELADRYALPPDEVRRALNALGPEVVSGQLTAGRGEEWIDRRNLEQIHRQTLSILRKEVQPVPIAAYAEFLRRWQGVGDTAAQFRPDQVDGDEHQASVTRLRRTLQQLRGLAIPGAIWERDVLPARVSGFDSTTLGELCQAGEVMWVAEGGKDAHRARVRFFFRGEGGLFLDRRPDEAALAELGESARLVYDYLTGEGAALLADVAEGTGLSRTEAQGALVELVLEGLVTNDSLDALRTVLGYEPPPSARDRPFSSLAPQLAELIPRTTRHHPSRHRLILARRRARDVVLADLQSRRTTWVGRWSPVHRPGLLGKALPEDEVALRQARQLLARWGVVTRVCFERESARLTWDALYPVLSRLEVRGEVRRGYFVEGLPGIQFAAPEAVEQLRAANRDRLNRSPGLGDSPYVDDASVWTPVVLSAADPAQLYGAESFGGPLRFQRVASTAVA
ncbi:MAG TPA: helicase-related protein, partial [Chloroflexota bacterium]